MVLSSVFISGRVGTSLLRLRCFFGDFPHPEPSSVIQRIFPKFSQRIHETLVS